jgi:DNA ligase-1
MILKFNQFVNEILADNSRLAKIAVLEKYKDDEDVKYLLNFVYNPYIVTGISDKKLNKELPQVFDLWSDNTFESDKEVFEYIKTHNTGRDEDIRVVQNYELDMLRPLGWQVEVLYEKIITKNLQLGIDSKTINKVIPGLIPEFNVQLSNKYFDKPEIVEGKEFVLTTKIDGSRIIAMKDNGQVSFWTRQGQPYEGLVDLENELKNIQEDNFVFDGEIVAMETSKEDTYKNTMKLSRTKDTAKHGLKMLVFDYMPIANFKMQCCPMTYSARRGTLSAIFDLNKLTFFTLLPMLYKGTDTSKIIEFLNDQTDKGEEGIMINICDAPYDFKRSNNLLKVKKFLDTEVKIIGYEEGANKLAGTLGAFICEYKNNTVKVGSGLSDEDRAYFWANKDKYLNKYITVKYFEESYDSRTNLPSLRFPIYMRVREDI